MANNLYITATESKSGKSAIVLGIMHLLIKNVGSVAIFRPIINEPAEKGQKDHDINLVLTHFGLTIPYEDTYAYTLSEARKLINQGQHAVLLDNILKKYKNLEAKYDFVLCEGTDYVDTNPAFEFDLNADIAANLSTPVLIITNALEKNAETILESTQTTVELLDEKGLDVIGCIVNRASVSDAEKKLITTTLAETNKDRVPLTTYFLPEVDSLGKPTVADVAKWLNAQTVYGQERMDTFVDSYLVAAMQAGNFLDYVDKGSLIITPGDRVDIILACLGTRTTTAYEDIAGIVLTGGLNLPTSIRRLIDGWTGTPLPIIAVQEHTLKTVQILAPLYGKIEPTDTRKISTALGHFEANINGEEIANRIVNMRTTKITPKMFEFNLLDRAASNKMRIVLPEGTDERILRATDILTRRNVADIILIGNPDEVGAKITELGLDIHVPILKPEAYPKFNEYAEAYCEARKKKGISIEQARDAMCDPTYFATMMVKQGDADGMVSGAMNTTAHTIRPAFEFIKTKPNASIVSSVFLMCLKDKVLVFGDCAVNPNPTSDQLADIAISSAATAKIFGVEPRVAMLSYSTGSSGKGADVDIVIEATRLAQERAPELALEGPIQYDAAIDPDVARTKLPNSKVAGKATVFIFPDLNTGNNTYKAVQRAANAVAIGPVLQGLNKPVNDLSRGCTVADIVNTVAITAVQAQAEKA